MTLQAPSDATERAAAHSVVKLSFPDAAAGHDGMSARAAAVSDAATASDAPFGLVDQFDVLARSWGLAGPPQSSGRSSVESPTPEVMASLAAQRGLEVGSQQRSVASLQLHDCPCIVLMRDGSTLLLLAVESGQAEILDGAGRRREPVAAIKASEGGIVFFPRPAVPDLRGASGVAARPPQAGQQGHLPGVLSLILGEFWRHHRGRLLQLLFANVIGNVLLMALPLYSMAVYDRVIPHLAMETLWALTIGAGLALASDLLVRLVKARVIDAASYAVSTRVQARYFNRLVHSELASAPRSPAAGTQGLRDIEGLCLAIPTLLATVLVDLPFLAVITALLVSFGGWVALVPLLAIAVLMAIHAGSHFASESESMRKAMLSRAQSDLLHETIEGLEGVKVATAERQMLRRWERMADAAAYSGHRSRMWGGVAGLASISLGQFVVVFAMFAAVLEISNGLLTIGALSATSMLVGRMLAPVTQVVSALHHMSMLLKTLDGIDTVLRAPIEEAGDPTRPDRIAGPIEFRAVNFSHEANEAGGLKDITFTIQPGEKVALIGRIGSGKSTVLRLMVRLLVPRSGAVLVDGSDIRQYDPRSVRRTMGFMSQSHMLFDDTLHANLMVGLGPEAAAHFERAVTLSGVKALAARHPQGYSMRVGRRGEKLSGGERQLVALARCLMADRSVVILDEPTAAMDNALEARVVRDLKTALAGQTLVVATHRATVLDLVDRIIWLEDGRVVMDGPKDQVLSRLKRTAA